MALASAPPVLVVGAGPVGLLTAVALRLRDVPVQVLERRREPSSASLASTFHPPVLDLLADLGLLNRLEPLGQQVKRIATWNLDRGERQEVDLAMLASSTKHPYRLHLEQQHLVAALEEWLEVLAPGSLIRGVEVLACDQAGPGENADTAKLHARDADGVLQAFVGSWVVAADGAHSLLRQTAALPFCGHDEIAPVVRLFLPRLPSLLEQKLAPLTYVRRGDRSLSFLQMRHGWRVILRPAPEEVSCALACPSPLADAQREPPSPWSLELLSTVFKEEVDPGSWMKEAIEQDHYPIRQRRVETHCLGRLLLVGDAAHVTNTRGGLNMNFGLLEGWALAEALSSWWHSFQKPTSGFHENLNGVNPVRAWADCWQQRTANVLLPRTDCMRGSGTLFDLGSTSTSAGQEKAGLDLKALLIRATLLDLVHSDHLIP